MDAEEKLLLAIVVGLAVLMFAGSFQYSPVEAAMPRAASGLVVFFAAVTLVQEYVDGLEAESSTSPLDVDTELPEEGAEDSQAIGRGEKEFSAFGVTLPIRIVVAVLLTAYLVFGYLIGLFWSSLVFVLLYARLTGLNRRRTVGLLVLTFLTLYVFGALLNVPVTDAYLLSIGVAP